MEGIPLLFGIPEIKHRGGTGDNLEEKSAVP